MKKTVYDAFTREVVFEGTIEECWKWIFDHGYKTNDGRIIYHTWNEGKDRFIDVGEIFIFNEK